ncbi:hypothetical protein Agub_g2802, partial [Astrephomene gubernaculifera]
MRPPSVSLERPIPGMSFRCSASRTTIVSSLQTHYRSLVLPRFAFPCIAAPQCHARKTFRTPMYWHAHAANNGAGNFEIPSDGYVRSATGQLHPTEPSVNPASQPTAGSAAATTTPTANAPLREFLNFGAVRVRLNRIRTSLIQAFRDWLAWALQLLQYRLMLLLRLPTWGKLAALVAAGLPVVAAGSWGLRQVSEVSWQEALQYCFYVLNNVPGTDVTRLPSLPPRLVLIAVHLTSLWSFAALVGLVTEDVRAAVEGIRSGNFPLPARGHTLLLDPKVPPHRLRELVQQVVAVRQSGRPGEGSQGGVFPGCIAVLSTQPKADLDEQLASWLPPRLARLVVTRHGSPMKVDDLRRVAAAAAHTVILLAPSGPMGHQQPSTGEGEDSCDDGDEGPMGHSDGYTASLSPELQQELCLVALMALHSETTTTATAASSSFPIAVPSHWQWPLRRQLQQRQQRQRVVVEHSCTALEAATAHMDARQEAWLFDSAYFHGTNTISAGYYVNDDFVEDEDDDEEQQEEEEGEDPFLQVTHVSSLSNAFSRVAVQCAVQPGLAAVFDAIFCRRNGSAGSDSGGSSGGSGASLHVVPLPDHLAGLTFAQVRRHFPRAAVCGIILPPSTTSTSSSSFASTATSSSASTTAVPPPSPFLPPPPPPPPGPVLLCPPDHLLMQQPGQLQLLLLAPSRRDCTPATATATATAAAAAASATASTAASDCGAADNDSDDGITSACESRGGSGGSSRTGCWFCSTADGDRCSAVGGSSRSSTPAAAAAGFQLVLVSLDSRGGLGAALRGALREFMRPGSTVTLVTPEPCPDLDLNMDMDLTAGGGDGGSSDSTPGGGSGGGGARLHFRNLVGDPLSAGARAGASLGGAAAAAGDEAVLWRAGVAEADAVILTGLDSLPQEQADATAAALALTLQKLLARAAAEAEMVAEEAAVTAAAMTGAEVAAAASAAVVSPAAHADAGSAAASGPKSSSAAAAGTSATAPPPPSQLLPPLTFVCSLYDTQNRTVLQHIAAAGEAAGAAGNAARARSSNGSRVLAAAAAGGGRGGGRGRGGPRPRPRGLRVEVIEPAALQSGMLAQVASEPLLGPCLADLLDEQGCELYVRRPEEYGLVPYSHVTWGQVCEAVRGAGGPAGGGGSCDVALGYITTQAAAAAAAGDGRRSGRSGAGNINW